VYENIGVALSDNRKTEVSVDKHLNVSGSVNFRAEEKALHLLQLVNDISMP
jgi:hypothetical protein